MRLRGDGSHDATCRFDSGRGAVFWLSPCSFTLDDVYVYIKTIHGNIYYILL